MGCFNSKTTTDDISRVSPTPAGEENGRQSEFKESLSTRVEVSASIGLGARENFEKVVPEKNEEMNAVSQPTPEQAEVPHIPDGPVEKRQSDMKSVGMLKAITDGDLAFVERQIKMNANMEINVIHEQDTFLTLAIINGKDDIFNALLQHADLDLNFKNKQGLTPIQVAACHNKAKMLKTLLEKSPPVNLNALDDNGKKLMDHLLKKMNPADLNLVLKHVTGKTDLNPAACIEVNDMKKHVEELLTPQFEEKIKKLSNDKVLVDDTCQTLLHYIAKVKNGKYTIDTDTVKNVLQDLCEIVDVNIQDFDGSTALHIAIEKNNLTFFQAVSQAPGVDFSITDLNGRTLHHLAISMGNTEIVKILLSHNQSKIFFAKSNAVQTRTSMRLMNEATDNEDAAKCKDLFNNDMSLLENGTLTINNAIDIINSILGEDLSGETAEEERRVKLLWENHLEPLLNSQMDKEKRYLAFHTLQYTKRFRNHFRDKLQNLSKTRLEEINKTLQEFIGTLTTLQSIEKETFIGQTFSPTADTLHQANVETLSSTFATEVKVALEDDTLLIKLYEKHGIGNGIEWNNVYNHGRLLGLPDHDFSLIKKNNFWRVHTPALFLLIYAYKLNTAFNNVVKEVVTKYSYVKFRPGKLKKISRIAEKARLLLNQFPNSEFKHLHILDPIRCSCVVSAESEVTDLLKELKDQSTNGESKLHVRRVLNHFHKDIMEKRTYNSPMPFVEITMLFEHDGCKMYGEIQVHLEKTLEFKKSAHIYVQIEKKQI